MKYSLLILLATSIFIMSFSPKPIKGKKNKIADPIEIRLDNVAFDELSQMTIMDADNRAIAYYDRFDNKSSAVKSMRVYNLDGKLSYTLVPIISDWGFEIHIKDADGTRGLVRRVANTGGLKVVYETDVDYFRKPFDSKAQAAVGIGKVKMNEYVRFKDKAVISFETRVSITSGIQVSPYIVSSAFLERNKLDVANWVLILHLMGELSFELSKSTIN